MSALRRASLTAVPCLWPALCDAGLVVVTGLLVGAPSQRRRHQQERQRDYQRTSFHNNHPLQCDLGVSERKQLVRRATTRAHCPQGGVFALVQPGCELSLALIVGNESRGWIRPVGRDPGLAVGGRGAGNECAGCGYILDQRDPRVIRRLGREDRIPRQIAATTFAVLPAPVGRRITLSSRCWRTFRAATALAHGLTAALLTCRPPPGTEHHGLRPRRAGRHLGAHARRGRHNAVQHDTQHGDKFQCIHSSIIIQYRPPQDAAPRKKSRSASRTQPGYTQATWRCRAAQMCRTWRGRLSGASITSGGSGTYPGPAGSSRRAVAGLLRISSSIADPPRAIWRNVSWLSRMVICV